MGRNILTGATLNKHSFTCYLHAMCTREELAGPGDSVGGQITCRAYPIRAQQLFLWLPRYLPRTFPILLSGGSQPLSPGRYEGCPGSFLTFPQSMTQWELFAPYSSGTGLIVRFHELAPRAPWAVADLHVMTLPLSTVSSSSWPPYISWNHSCLLWSSVGAKFHYLIVFKRVHDGTTRTLYIR